MNIEHLKKQAKNLKKLYPRLVAYHGQSLTLSQAQQAIAQIHGFDSWEELVVKGGQQTSLAFDKAGFDQRYKLIVEKTPTTILLGPQDDFEDPEDAEESRFLVQWVATDPAADDAAVDAFDEKLESLPANSGSMGDYSAARAAKMISVMRTFLKSRPFFIDAYAHLGGALFMQGKYAEALAVVEPLATHLLSRIPKRQDIFLQYYILSQRPLFRLIHTYILALDKVGRHGEADGIASRMLHLSPMDPMGFRFLLTKELRAEDD